MKNVDAYLGNYSVTDHLRQLLDREPTDDEYEGWMRAFEEAIPDEENEKENWIEDASAAANAADEKTLRAAREE